MRLQQAVQECHPSEKGNSKASPTPAYDFYLETMCRPQHFEGNTRQSLATSLKREFRKAKEDRAEKEAGLGSS